MLNPDGIDEFLGDPAAGISVEGHAATVVEGHAYRSNTALQALVRQVAQVLNAQAGRVGSQLR